MDAKDFLRRIVPDDGVCYIGTITNAGYKQHKVNTVEELNEQVVNYNNADVYFSTGTYIDGTSREAANVKSKKALYLDIDCGVGKDYSNKDTAVKALRDFVIDSGISMPNILVDSGNGMHAYYSFDAPIDVNDWLVYANALKAACEDCGFAVDPKVTTDAARILRVPGTYNYKERNRPVKCKVLYANPDFAIDDLKSMLSQWLRPVGLPNIGTQVDNSDLGSSNYENKIWKAEYIFDECPTMAYSLVTGGEQDTEPFWAALLNVLAFCEDGEDWIHKIGDKHPGYTPESTVKKYKNKLHSKDLGRTKPTLCKTFGQYASNKCADCEHNGHINSPISLGKPPPNELPQGYEQSGSGVFRLADDKRIFCFPYQLKSFNVIDYGKGVKEITVDSMIGRSAVYNIQIPYEYLGDDKILLKRLANCGMVFLSSQLREFKTLMVYWTQQMEAAKRVSKGTLGFGWTKREGKYGFKLANKIVWEDGEVTDAPVGDRAISEQYEPEGTLEKWKEAADMVVNSKLIELQVALASAFASPLIPFTGTSGTMLSIVSAKSGTGKSSALRTAQAVWGSPLHGINSVNDTSNSVAKRLGELHNLPAYWDELHMGDDVDQFIQLIFRLGQGKEKTRLKSDASFQKVGTWATLITVASNESVSDHMDVTTKGTNAGAMRVLELEMSVSGVGNGGLANAMKIFGRLNENYGWAGVEYATYITTNREEVKNRMTRILHTITAAKHVDSSDRFRLATITSLVVGAYYAKKCGLVNFDVPRILKYLMAKVDTERAEAKETGDTVSNPLHGIKTFIDTFADNTYITEFYPTRNVHNDVGTIISAPKKFPVHIHHAQQMGLVRLDYVLLKDWLTKKYGAGKRQLTAARQLTGVKYIQRATLTSGLPSHVPGNYTQVLEIAYTTLDALGN